MSDTPGAVERPESEISTTARRIAEYLAERAILLSKPDVRRIEDEIAAMPTLLAAHQPAAVRPSVAILAAAHEVQRCAEIEGGAMETADAGVALARLVLAEVRPDEPAPPEVRGEVEHVPTSSGKRKVLMAYLPDDAPFGNRESVTVRIVPGGGR
mgnify:CR=1 FL=1